MSARSTSYVLEPDPLTNLEVAWANAPHGSRLLRKRTTEYDAGTFLFYKPIRYTTVPLDAVSRTAPTDEWLRDNFARLVLGDPEHTPCRGVTPPPFMAPPDDSKNLVADTLIYQYLEVCERECVYHERIDALLRDTTLTREGKLCQLLCHEPVGTPANKPHDLTEVVTSSMRSAQGQHLPIQFILPAFPFKDQTPFRSCAPARHVDFGEIALLARLHIIALAIYQIYNFSAEWIIVSDSVAYAPLFGIEVSEARTYRERLRAYRHLLNMNRTVHILDLDDMTTRIDGFQDVYSHIVDKLKWMRASGILADRFRVLARGMKWNINTRPYLEKGRCSWEHLWNMLDQENPETSTAVAKEIDTLSQDAGLHYAAHNLTMKHLDLLRCCFPDAIRATVHPKPGQVAIPMLGETFPWNGTALLAHKRLGPEAVQTVPLYKILRAAHSIPVYLPGAEAPFFFLQQE